MKYRIQSRINAALLLAFIFFIWAGPANAQGPLDGNFLSRNESLLPDITIEPSQPTVRQVTKERKVPVYDFRDVEVDRLPEPVRKDLYIRNMQNAAGTLSAEQRGLIQQARPGRDVPFKQNGELDVPALTSQPPAAVEEMAKLFGVYESTQSEIKELGLFPAARAKGISTTTIVSKRVQVDTKTVTETKTVVEPPKTQHVLILTAGHSFQSNALRTNTRVVNDNIYTASPVYLMTVPLRNAKDTFTFKAQTSQPRYQDLSSRSNDAFVWATSFTRKIDRRFRSKKTQETVTLEYEQSSYFDTGFKGDPSSFFIPSLTWTRTKIPLGNQLCGAPDSDDYCLTATISAQARRVWADSANSDKFSGRVSLSVNKKIRNSKFSVSVSGAVGADTYDKVDGGREDIDLSASLGLTWKVLPHVAISGSLGYNNHDSTIDRNDWDGFNVSPGIKLTYLLGERPRR